MSYDFFHKFSWFELFLEDIGIHDNRCLYHVDGYSRCSQRREFDDGLCFKHHEERLIWNKGFKEV